MESSSYSQVVYAEVFSRCGSQGLQITFKARSIRACARDREGREGSELVTQDVRSWWNRVAGAWLLNVAFSQLH